LESNWNDDISQFVGGAMMVSVRSNYCKNTPDPWGGESVKFAQCMLLGIRSRFTPVQFFHYANNDNEHNPVDLQYYHELVKNCLKEAGCSSPN